MSHGLSLLNISLSHRIPHKTVSVEVQKPLLDLLSISQQTLDIWAYVGLMLGQRLRRCPNIKPTYAGRLVGMFKR